MGLISDDIRAAAKAAIDGLMAATDLGGLGRRCTLVFPPKRTACPNCLYDQPNKRSANKHKTGGPQPFPDGGLCPVCSGKGAIEEAVSREVVLLCDWRDRRWVNAAGTDLVSPGGTLQTKGLVADRADVLRARRLLIDGALFELDGEPSTPGNIVVGEYFVASWRRVS